MAKQQIRVHDLITDKVIDREMTDEELSQHNKMLETLAAEKAERETKEAAKLAIADRLGLTADELKILLG